VKKEKVSITVDEKLLKWIDSRIKEKVFANRSHAFEFAITKLAED